MSLKTKILILIFLLLFIPKALPDYAQTKINADSVPFAPAVNYGAGEFSVFGGDLDNDTDLDLAAANYNSHNISILLNGACTSYVEQEEEAATVTSFFISQNYPNPFNQTTKIEFALAKSGFVTLQIYDLLGRKVRTLVSEHLSSGYKSVLWDGKNDAGKDAASGVYLYLLKTENYEESKKMVLLK